MYQYDTQLRSPKENMEKQHVIIPVMWRSNSWRQFLPHVLLAHEKAELLADMSV